MLVPEGKGERVSARDEKREKVKMLEYPYTYMNRFRMATNELLLSWNGILRYSKHKQIWHKFKRRTATIANGKIWSIGRLMKRNREIERERVVENGRNLSEKQISLFCHLSRGTLGPVAGTVKYFICIYLDSLN